MEKALATQATFNWSPEQVRAIKDTVARGATDSELEMLFHVSKTYGLDPFLREIQLIKGKSGITLYTTRDGYLKIAHVHHEEDFDGMRSDVLRESDIFKTTGLDVQHEYSSKRGRILGAWCMVYRKSKRVPFYFFAPFDEYYKNGADNWRQYPSAMIQKVAEAMCLKRAFSISGLVTREEMDVKEEIEVARDAELVVDSKEPIRNELPNTNHEDDNEYSSEENDRHEPLPEKVKEEINRSIADKPKAPEPGIRDPKIVVWERYINYFKTQENAKAAIERIIGFKPSKEWTKDDLEKIDGNIDKLEKEQMSIPFDQEIPEVKEPKEEDEFKGIGPDEKPAPQLEKSKQKLAREETDLMRAKLINMARELVGLTEKEYTEWLRSNYQVVSTSQLMKDKVRDALNKMQKVLDNRDKQKRLPDETGGLV